MRTSTYLLSKQESTILTKVTVSQKTTFGSSKKFVDFSITSNKSFRMNSVKKIISDTPQSFYAVHFYQLFK